VQGSDLERTITAYAALWRGLAERTPLGSYVEVDGVARVRTGVPAPTFNGVWALHPSPELATVLAAVDSFVVGDLPWIVQLRPGSRPELAAALTERGLVVTDEVPFMVLTDLAALPDAAVVELREVVTFDDADVALTLLEHGFEMPAELTRRSIPLAMFFMAGAHTWIAADGGVDVCTAQGVVSDRVCGVFNVATPVEHRRKGYGAAATAATVQHASAMGADLAFLQSTAMGYGVYERLGFVTVETWTQWTPREYAASG
jgi:GNAT superfamily N-acetyltransferase